MGYTPRAIYPYRVERLMIWYPGALDTQSPVVYYTVIQENHRSLKDTDIQMNIINRLPQILFTLLGLILLWAMLGVSNNLVTTLSHIIYP